MMIKNISEIDASPLELRELVKWSVALLGQVIEKEAGTELYLFIEHLRQQMSKLRENTSEETLPILSRTFSQLIDLESSKRLVVARAYTLMLQLINACENAYRSVRLSEHRSKSSPMKVKVKAEAIIFVLTAHPTEARSPQSIEVFHRIQKTLIGRLRSDRAQSELEKQLLHELQLGWRVAIVRNRSPRVKDEAEHIYSTLLKDEILISLLESSQELVPVYVRTWVGGDKDGHPGVDEKVMRESLSLSREFLIAFAERCIDQVRETQALLPKHPLEKDLISFQTKLGKLKVLRNRDGARMKKLREALALVSRKYENEMGLNHPRLRTLRRLSHVFPAWVVPLEIRESSDILMSEPKGLGKLAIDRMLLAIAKISRGGDPRWYARGFIVSMTQSIEHLRVADLKVRAALKPFRIPVIPLFEEMESLQESTTIVQQMIQDRKMGKAIRENDNGVLEVMVGYSDSSKEGGVFPSRYGIAQAMSRLDRLGAEQGINILFFQGSGGSVDRGGGTVQDQIAWWPRSALKNYKVTIQGEMVERSFSSPEIIRGQIGRISDSVSSALSHSATPFKKLPAVQRFADRISEVYRKTISQAEFLTVAEHATPYLDLTELKMGSRPTRRSSQLLVKGLRAIPWVLCWTQTRVLFPTWWGVGSAWKKSSSFEREMLRKAFREEPVFTSFVRTLCFTLAKVELDVWFMYLRESGIESTLVNKCEGEFKQELGLALQFAEFVTGEKNLLWYRPWLGASIRLRSPMIHPLNLLQIIAMKEHDVRLLRLTVTGISSGMMTTG